MMLFSVNAAAEEPDGAGSEESARLGELRDRIRDVESNLRTARDDSEALMTELQEAETAIGQTGARLHELNAAIALKTASLARYRIEEESQQEILSRERTQLAAQIRAAYKTGRHDFLKLLLNQEDPALIGRMLAYHDYYSRARARNIESVGVVLLRLEDVQRAIREEAAQLEQLQGLELAKLTELQSHRESRSAVLARLRDYIDSQDRELQVLQRNERELAALLDRLVEEQSEARIFAAAPPFANLKGQLEWPVDGTITNRFGAPRMGGRLRFQGVTINADAGTAVHAVSTGKVIFADWFRNMGLLIILDHGGGFMSLYGHNETLLKKAGDVVRPGEVIARVGETGGQEQAGLYFEIRESGNPLDPDLWCRG